MIFSNDGEKIIAVTTIPTCTTIQWITGISPDQTLWSASIQNKDSTGSTVLSHSTEEVWLITKLTIANNTLVYPYRNTLRNGFNERIGGTAPTTLAEFQTLVQNMTYWELV